MEANGGRHDGGPKPSRPSGYIPPVSATEEAAPGNAIAGRRTFADRLFLAFVALLPLHTVHLEAWISWKPWLVFVLVLVIMDAVAGLRDGRWPWHRRLSIGAGVFLAAAAASWSGAAPERFLRLWLALVVGSAVLLVVARRMQRPGALFDVLRVVFWSGAAIAVTGLVVSIASVGGFGEGAVLGLNDLPLVDRVATRIYRAEGMVAVTNWHQDPGYAAAWLNLWWVLGFLAVRRGAGSGRRWLDAAVIGGLWLGVIMTLSRTGLLGTAVGAVAILWHHRSRPARGEVLRLAGAAALATLVLLGAVWGFDRQGVGGDLGIGLSVRFAQGFTLGPGDEDPSGAYIYDYRDSRSVVWPIYFDYFVEHPIRGVGLGTGWEEALQEPHNILLELLGEMGLVGLAGFAFLFAAVLGATRNPIGRIALLVALTAAMTQTVLFEPTWWFAAALATAPDG